VVDETVRSYVVVCRGPNCRERGALPLRRQLQRLLHRESSTQVLGYACFGQCDFGPNVAFYPEGLWFGGLATADAAERVARHAAGLESLEAPLLLPEVEKQEHLANIAELVTTIERDRARRHSRPWWWPF
jgi:(2Fe-2S) ferredoxin